QRTGVGEYTHQLAKALLASFAADSSDRRLELSVFSSSWKDRLELSNGDLHGAFPIDRRVPVSVLNLAWHRLGWPPAEALGGGAGRVRIGRPGAPDWPARTERPRDGGYILFVGTLEPRKNVGTLLDVYERLSAHRGAAMPPLILAGRAVPESREWLDRIARPPLKAVVRHLGYVDPSKRRELYEGARLLVQPSHEEGFGLPVLEAMAL